jgi:adenylate cyclase
MAKEIERKFLVDFNMFVRYIFQHIYISPHSVDKYIPQKVFIRQGYILDSNGLSIRIRLEDDNKAILTYKNSISSMVRNEYEMEIPYEDGFVLYNNTPHKVSKTRVMYLYKGKTWEIDIFCGANEGLVVAEIELDSETDTIDKPPFCYGEVTTSKHYLNSNLAKHPYCTWDAEY